ncbi:MAG TPA: F0F1 ATP synthase subunit delta [Thermopetrobacter sp.]|nr:F0F1 ATP synthase subunit delta [Thermopetrobacter sp.]
MRYARALFALAGEEGVTEGVGEDLEALAGAIDAAPDLARFIASPLHDAKTQIAVLDAIMEKLGTGPLVRRFVHVVAGNRRLALLPQMIAAWRAIIARARGEIHAEVTSASPLTAAQMRKVEKALREALDSEVQIANEVDPSLIGGLVVKIGSRMIDTSLRTRLNTLKSLLKGA